MTIKTRYVLQESFKDGWTDIIEDRKKSEILKKKTKFLELNPTSIVQIIKREFEITIKIISEKLIKE